jgi:hypothetical protein
MTDFAIQRGRATIAAAGTSITITAGTDYTAPASATAAFIRIVGTSSAGTGVQDSDFAGAVGRNAILITNPTNLATSITFERASTGGEIDIEWEIIEYVGSSGGVNELIVRHVEAISASTATTVDSSSVSGVSDANDIAVFLTSVGGGSTAGRNESDEILYTSEYISGSTLARLTRGASASRSVSTSLAVVEFTGSNWKVQRISHDYSADATDETETITTTLGSTSKAFVHHQSRIEGAGDGQSSFGQNCWISSTSQLTFNKEDITTAATGVAWVIENTQSSGSVMSVLQYSGTRATNVGGDPDEFTQTVTTVNALAESSVMGEGSNTTQTSDVHRGMLGFRMTGASTVTMTRGRDVGNRDWRFQVVEWPTAAGGGTTVGITGVQSTSSSGTVAFTKGGSLALTGIASTPAVGSVSVTSGASVALTGIESTPAVGSVSFTKSGSIGLTSEASTTNIGSVGFSRSGSAALTGSESTFSVGTIEPLTGVTVALTGTDATPSAGSLGFTKTGQVALTSASLSALVGSLTVLAAPVPSIPSKRTITATSSRRTIASKNLNRTIS